MNYDLLFFVTCYTALIALASYVHFNIGYKRGIKDTLLSMRAHEPKAVDNALRKMQENIDAELD